MNKTLFYFAITVLILSCSKEETNYLFDNLDDKISPRSQKVDVCHYGNILSVNINALPAHEAHGDAVDLDGDGWFNKDNECGPIDCNDSDDSETDSCCAVECLFCPKMNFYDFDEPCIDDFYGYGDYYCNYTFTWDWGQTFNYCDDCTYSGTYHYAYIYDIDYEPYQQYCNNDTNDENDYGFIYASWGTYNLCCEEYIWGYVAYYLYDYDTDTFIEDENSYNETQQAHDLAELCSEIIVEIANEEGMEDQCDDLEIFFIEGQAKSDFEENVQVILNEKMPHEMIGIQGMRIDQELPDEFTKKLLQVNK